MKKLAAYVSSGVGILLVAFSADTPPTETWAGTTLEYASVRWGGDKTSIIWPDGTTQKVVAFGGKRRPDGIDERAWYVTGAMNIMAKRGFELVHMGNEDVVMKRIATKPKD